MLNAKHQMRNEKVREKKIGHLSLAMYHFRQRQRGFTLIELILYIAISSVFLTGAVFFAWDVIYGRVKSYVQQEVNQNMRFATKRIMYEIRNASNINSVTSSSVSLAMADAARNPTVIDVSNGVLRIGYGNSGSCPTSAPCPLTGSHLAVTNLTFTNLSQSPNSLHVKFSLTISATGGTKEFQETQTYDGAVEVRSR